MHIMRLLGLPPLLERRGHAPGTAQSRKGRDSISIMKEESYGTATRSHTRPGPGTISRGFRRADRRKRRRHRLRPGVDYYQQPGDGPPTWPFNQLPAVRDHLSQENSGT